MDEKEQICYQNKYIASKYDRFTATFPETRCQNRGGSECVYQPSDRGRYFTTVKIFLCITPIT